MAKCMKLESPKYSDNDDTYDTGMDIMCSDEPINLKQVNDEPNHSQEDGSCDWETSKLVKTKAFRIKDILGLDDSEKLTRASKSIQDVFIKASNTSSAAPSMISQISCKKNI